MGLKSNQEVDVWLIDGIDFPWKLEFYVFIVFEISMSTFGTKHNLRESRLSSAVPTNACFSSGCQGSQAVFKHTLIDPGEEATLFVSISMLSNWRQNIFTYAQTNRWQWRRRLRVEFSKHLRRFYIYTVSGTFAQTKECLKCLKKTYSGTPSLRANYHSLGIRASFQSRFIFEVRDWSSFF